MRLFETADVWLSCPGAAVVANCYQSPGAILNAGVAQRTYSSSTRRKRECSNAEENPLPTSRSALFKLGLFFALTTVALAQTPEPKPRFPLNFDFNLGGMTPSGPTGQAYSGSVLVGGGANLPLNRWFTWDVLTIDAGFGTGGGSRIITLSDNSKRSTANYSAQLMSGWRLMMPLKRGGSGRLEIAGGWAGIQHQEYGVGKVSYAGTTRVQEQIQCNSCFSTFGSGYYGLVQLGSRNRNYRGAGVFVKWLEVLDNGKGFSPIVGFPKQQRWITFGLNFTFGFGG